MSDIQFITVDADQIQRELINGFETALQETLYPADERRIFLNQQLPVIVGLKNEINENAKQNLLRYASGDILAALGEFFDVVRIPAQKAKTTFRFTLSSVQISDTPILSGRRATPDGSLYFATVMDIIIPAGQITGDVIAEATEGGEKYNNFVPGQIKTLVDPIAYVVSVENINTSSGGSDLELDDNFRERIRQAPESYSVAGPEGAYIYWAKTANSEISDVSVSSPSPGVVRIVPLLSGGGIPTQDILDEVLAIVSAKDKRPLTDMVQVAAPTQVTYNIEFTYYISSARLTEVPFIRDAIEGTKGVVQQFIQWQHEKLGRAINPDELRYRLIYIGASRIVLNSPVYELVDLDKVAKEGTINIIFGGVE